MYCLHGRYLNAGDEVHDSLTMKFKSAVVFNVCTERPEQISLYYVRVKELNLLAHKK